PRISRATERARAALFGYHPSSPAIARIRSLVVSETPGRPFRAYETAPFETPARAAMSLIVTLRAPLAGWANPVLLPAKRPSCAAHRHSATANRFSSYSI